MKFRVIIWLFSFFCFVILLKGGERTTCFQTITYTDIVPTASISSFTNTNYNTDAPQTMVFTKSIIDHPAPGFYPDESKLFAATGKRTDPSLLVVERWESSPLRDVFSKSPDLLNSYKKNLPPAEKLTMNDYLALLYSTAAGREQ